jgi:tetratricopeptide (TPR) repeat protein
MLNMQSKTAGGGEMNLEEARRLLELSRKAHWSFPSSLGRPIRWEGPEEWVEESDKERNSYIKAVTFLVRTGHEDMAVEMAANVWRLWVLAKDDNGGRRLLAPVLGKSSHKPTKSRALALYGDSLLAIRLGKTDESRRAGKEALKVARLVGDPEALALANLALSRVTWEDGDYKQSLSRAREARRLARGLDPAFGQAPLFMEAQSSRMLGDYEKAASLFRESVELNRRIGDRGMVIAELSNLGLVEIHRDKAEAAERSFDESERISGSGTKNPYGQGMAILNEAMVAFRKGHVSQARSLLQRVRTTFEESGVEPAKDDKFEIDWLDQELKKVKE